MQGLLATCPPPPAGLKSCTRRSIQASRHKPRFCRRIVRYGMYAGTLPRDTQPSLVDTLTRRPLYTVCQLAYQRLVGACHMSDMTVHSTQSPRHHKLHHTGKETAGSVPPLAAEPPQCGLHGAPRIAAEFQGQGFLATPHTHRGNTSLPGRRPALTSPLLLPSYHTANETLLAAQRRSLHSGCTTPDNRGATLFQQCHGPP